MILIVCTDDPSLVHIARHSSNSNLPVFGNFYQAYHDQIPLLASGENLFIIAHGAYNGDDNNPVIGDKRKAFYVNAIELLKNIKNIFPHNYTGDIYVDACESADRDKDTFSFIEVLKTQIQVKYGYTEVYGRNGTVGGYIPTPGHRHWVRAEL